MIDKRWIKGEHHHKDTFWYIVSEFVRKGGWDCYLICYLISEQDKTFGWVYQHVCDESILDNPYSFVDENDVPEDVKDYISECLSDPFFEIEAERYKNTVNH